LIGRYAGTIIDHSQGIDVVRSLFVSGRQPDVDFWKDAYGVSCVKGILNKFSDGSEYCPRWIGKPRNLSVAVEEIRGAYLFKDL